MTREEAKELLPIIQAFAEGKKIEGRENGEDWYDIEVPTWSPKFVYRIKPEPKYRPFKTKEECWNEMMKHQPFGWIKGNVTGEYSQIIRVFEDETKLIFNTYYSCDSEYSPEMLLSGYTFTDGTPFGIKEE